MKIKLRSVTMQILLLYVFLAVINIAFFSMLINENQMDLIKDNVKLKSYELSRNIIKTINHYTRTYHHKKFKSTNKYMFEDIKLLIQKSKKNFVLFSEDGTVLYETKRNIKFNVKLGLKAIAGYDFAGQDFYADINEKKYVISFYIPVKIPHQNRVILFYNHQMRQIDKSLKIHYNIILILVFVIVFTHVIFAIILYWLFLKPVKKLHNKSNVLSQGNYSARVKIKRQNELGDLGKAFNNMAGSIQKHVTELKRRDEVLTFELEIAQEIQKQIYPSNVNNERVVGSIYHRPLNKVSGDYHDFFKLSENKLGFLLADVSGHGVPAALITMVAKDKFSKYCKEYHAPKDLFTQINNEVCELFAENSAYLTAFYAVYEDNQLVYSNAGHPNCILIRTYEKKLGILETGGGPIGMMKQFNQYYSQKKTYVNKGDKLVLFSDGILEATNNQGVLYGWDRLVHILSKNYKMDASQLIESVVFDLTSFLTDLNCLKDDVTLYINEFK